MTKAQLVRIYEKEIKKAISQLRSLSPEKIIIYGSAARGELREGSDIDFLIIKNTSKPFLERNIEAAKTLNLSVPYDIFVITPQELEQGEKDYEPFFIDVLKEGKVVYARR